MVNGVGLISGHRGLRGQVLLEIKKSQPITAKELGVRFSVSANAVRRHLKELELEGLVSVGREQHGIGAPVFVYRLTEHGEALFPNGYRDALTELLSRMVEREGRAVVVAMFEQRYDDLTRRFKAELAAAPREHRLETVARVLSEAGYMAEWHEAAGTFRLAEHNCAMRAIVEQFPEICAAEERFLREVLGAQVEREAHIASGCNCCEYAISFGGGNEAGCVSPQREQV
jgi:predicted ArsR family transcriptional regulator